MDVNELLKTAHAQGASDLHLKVGSHPIVRINGELTPFTNENRLSQEDTLKIAYDDILFLKVHAENYDLYDLLLGREFFFFRPA